MSDRIRFELSVPVATRQDRVGYIASCPVLEVYSQGPSAPGSPRQGPERAGDDAALSRQSQQIARLAFGLARRSDLDQFWQRAK